MRLKVSDPITSATSAAPPEDSDTTDAPERTLLLRGSRASIAVARFVAGETDLVLGGTLNDLPVARAAQPGPA